MENTGEDGGDTERCAEGEEGGEKTTGVKKLRFFSVLLPLSVLVVLLLCVSVHLKGVLILVGRAFSRVARWAGNGMAVSVVDVSLALGSSIGGGGGEGGGGGGGHEECWGCAEQTTCSFVIWTTTSGTHSSSIPVESCRGTSTSEVLSTPVMAMW